MKRILFFLVISAIPHLLKAQMVKIQLSGKYKIDTLSDTGRYLDNPKQFINLLGRDMNYYVGLLDNKKVYFNSGDIVFSDDFLNWIRQKMQSAIAEKDTISLQDYVDRYGEKSYRSAVAIGQTETVVLAILGKPTSKEKKELSGSVNEKLVYKTEYNSQHSYYFKDGILVKIEN